MKNPFFFNLSGQRQPHASLLRLFGKSRAGLMREHLLRFDRPLVVVDREKKDVDGRPEEMQLIYDYCGEPSRQAYSCQVWFWLHGIFNCAFLG
jgi:hypothetical protein